MRRLILGSLTPLLLLASLMLLTGCAPLDPQDYAPANQPPQEHHHSH